MWYKNRLMYSLPVCALSDMGTVLKVVTIPRESWHDLEEVVLEEMTVFRVRLVTIHNADVITAI